MQKVEAVLKGKIKTFLDEEDAKAREEAQRLQKIKEEAERKAQEEADKKARKAEEARQKVENAKNATAKKKAEEAAKKAEEAAQKAEAEKEAIANKVVEVEESPKNVRTEGGLMSTKKVWKFEVTDEAKVPKEFWVIDQKKINEAVKNGERELPGVRIFQDTQISIR